MKDKVGIVVVTYNRLEMLKDLISSLRKQEYTNYKIIIINNSSTDGTENFLEQQKDLIVITQENCGGAGGFFTGLKYVAEHDFDYAWVMDDDVLVKENSLSKLIEKTNNVEGFLCSKVVDSDGNPCNVPGIFMGKQKNGEVEWNKKIEENLIKLSVASFVSVLIPVKIIKDVGLSYKEFFIWGDDTEYTKRISSKYESYLCGTSIVEHRRKINKTLSIFSEKDSRRINNFYYFYRNTLFYEKKYSSSIKVLYRYCRVIVDLLRAFFSFKFYAFYIITRALFASFFFKPKVCYICKD